MPTIARHRADIAELSRLANRDLTVLWRHVKSGSIAFDLLNDTLPSLVDVYGSAAASLAADWYDELRADADVPGRFSAIAAELPGPSRMESLAGWVAGTFDPEAADDSLTAAQGGLQRIIADASRDTVTGSSIADNGARGWQRSAAGGCGFCQALAARGAVYSRDTVDFGAHDHCQCVAVPAFEGQPAPVKPYTPSERSVTDADRARTREWAAQHGY